MSIRTAVWNPNYKDAISSLKEVTSAVEKTQSLFKSMGYPVDGIEYTNDYKDGWSRISISHRKKVCEGCWRILHATVYVSERESDGSRTFESQLVETDDGKCLVGPDSKLYKYREKECDDLVDFLVRAMEPQFKP